MNDEKQPSPMKVDDADLEQALDEFETEEAAVPAKDVVAAMAAMIEGVRKAVA